MKLIKHYDFTKMIELSESEFNIEVGEKWANRELQHYVNKKENIFFDNGLHLRATFKNNVIESARINTKGKFFFQYGRIDIIAKVPKGLGTWPALWMMPQESKYGHWPRSGEIDIMEHNGHNLNKLYCCVHTEAYNHRDGDPYDYRIDIPGLSDDFQTYSLHWDEEKIVYILNDKEIITYKKGENNKDASHKGWPFDESFYIIFNLAMGGMFGGEVDYTSFPQDFIIKDIKVYQ